MQVSNAQPLSFFSLPGGICAIREPSLLKTCAANSLFGCQIVKRPKVGTIFTRQKVSTPLKKGHLRAVSGLV